MTAVIFIAFFTLSSRDIENRAEQESGVVRGPNTGHTAPERDDNPAAAASPDSPKHVLDDALRRAVLQGDLQFDVTWRSRKAPNDPDALVRGDMEELLGLANAGDPQAARFLLTASQSCWDAAETEAQLEGQIEELRQTRSVGYSELDGASLAQKDSEIQILIHAMRTGFDQCQAFRALDAGDEGHFQKLAARNGDTWAMVEYGNRLLPNAPDEAAGYFTQAWMVGELQSLKGLSRWALGCYKRGEDDDGLVESAAFALAYTALIAKRENAFNAAFDTAQLEAWNQQTRLAFDELLPNQRDLARQQARDLIEGNPNCCFR